MQNLACVACVQCDGVCIDLVSKAENWGCVGKTGGMNNVLLYKVVIGMDFSRDI